MDIVRVDHVGVDLTKVDLVCANPPTQYARVTRLSRVRVWLRETNIFGGDTVHYDNGSFSVHRAQIAGIKLS